MSISIQSASQTNQIKWTAFCVTLTMLSIALPIRSFGQDKAKLPSKTAKPDFQQVFADLAPNRTPGTRLKALELLRESCSYPESLDAIELLKTGLKDTNEEIRYESLSTLAFISFEHNLECPEEFLKMLDDTAPKIQENFQHLFNLYETFPPSAFGVALKLYNRASDEHKSNFLTVLAKTGKKDRRALKILFEAVSSDFANMRGNGTAGLWIATEDMEIVLPLYIERITDLDHKRKGTREFKGKYAATIVELTALATAGQFNKHLRLRHDEFTIAMKQLAVHRDRKLRRDCVRYVAACLELLIEDHKTHVERPELGPATEITNVDTIKILGTELASDEDAYIADNARKIVAFCKEIEALN